MERAAEEEVDHPGSDSDEGFFIAQNGPALDKCDNLVKRSINSLFNTKQGKVWRFCQKKNIKKFLINKDSCVLKRLKQERSHLPFTELYIMSQKLPNV